MDQLYVRAMKFAKNFNQRHHTSGISNIYVIRKLNQDGDVVGEYYGHNLLTDVGMSGFFLTGGYGGNFPTQLYIGNGTGNYNVTMSSIVSPVSLTAATVSDSTINYQYPLYYDSYSGLITVICRYMICYFDYTVSDILTDVVISEYGIGTSATNLWTHSWVYDNLGNRTTITKHVNERLEISVYFALSYNESYINDAWDQGKYILITTMHRFFDTTNSHMFPTSVYSYKRYDSTTSRSFTKSTSAIIDNVISRYATIASFNVSAASDVANEYIDGFCNWSTGFSMIERERLSETESFDIVVTPQFSHIMKDDVLQYNFGQQGMVPFTQLTPSHAYSYNYLTKQYDNEETFEQSNDKWYNETPMGSSFATPLYYTNNNEILQLFVYRNIHNTDPIVAFDTAVATIYATDKYWDTSSWVQITDPSNVPAELRYKKYWITNSQTTALNPVRGNRSFVISPVDNQYGESLSFISFPAYAGMCYSDITNRIFAIGSRVYRISDHMMRQFNTNDRINNNITYGYGDMIINAYSGTPNTLSYFDMTEHTPTVHTINIDSSIISNLINTYHTENHRGFVLFHSGTSCLKVDLRNQSIVTSILNDKKIAACIWGTDNYAYISSATGEDHTVHVNSLITDSAVQTFTLPSSINTPVFVFGHMNHVYVGDGSTYTYMLDVSDGTLHACETILPFVANQLQYMRFTCLDSMMIVYRYTQIDSHYDYLIQTTSPSVITSLGGLYTGFPEACNQCYHTLMEWRQNTIILISTYDRINITSVWNRTVDLGHFLADNTIVRQSHETDTPWIPYCGKHIIRSNTMFMIQNVIPHRIVGTTNTITAYNNMKNLRDKQWVLSFTNIPTYSGLPPGVIQ